MVRDIQFRLLSELHPGPSRYNTESHRQDSKVLGSHSYNHGRNVDRNDEFLHSYYALLWLRDICNALHKPIELLRMSTCLEIVETVKEVHRSVRNLRCVINVLTVENFEHASPVITLNQPLSNDRLSCCSVGNTCRRIYIVLTKASRLVHHPCTRVVCLENTYVDFLAAEDRRHLDCLDRLGMPTLHSNGVAQHQWLTWLIQTVLVCKH